MYLNEFYELCQKVKKEKPNHRLGQNYFIILSILDSSLAEKLIGSKFDPFYDDQNLSFFYEWLSVNWNDQGEHLENAKMHFWFFYIKEYV